MNNSKQGKMKECYVWSYFCVHPFLKIRGNKIYIFGSAER